MASVEIIPVEGRRAEKQFLLLPWTLYRGDPNWVPPLRDNQAELAGFRTHPFYDEADRQAFLALRDGEPVGRILAIVNHVHNRFWKERRGWVGFFESIDDEEVSGALFDAAWTWLRTNRMQAMRGPANPSINYEWALLVEGFEHRPTFLMTYNPSYYPRLWEAYGWRKAQDLFAYMAHISMLDKLDQKLAFVVEEATRRFRVKIRTMNRRRFDQEVRLFLDLYNVALAGTWGFIPLSEGEVKHFAANLKHLIVPELTAIAEVDGKVVGGGFAMLDYNPLLQKIDGRLFPFGFLRLLFGRRKLKRARLVSTNVIPEYQRWGVGLLLGADLLPRGLKWGIEEAEFSWILESNKLSRGTVERGGVPRRQTYRVYDYEPGA